MGRLIIIGPDGEPMAAYDHTGGYTATQQLDDQNRIRLPVVDSPVKYDTRYGGLEKDIEEDISERLKITFNKTDYDIKVGKRCEGLQFKKALDMPVINILQNAESNAMSLPLGNFTNAEQRYIRGDNLNLPEPPKTHYDEGAMSLQKTEAPMKKYVQPTELQFIDEDGGKYYTNLFKPNEVNEMGSNVLANQYFDDNGGRNQPVGDRTTESLYEQQMGYNTVSNDNIKQQNNFKAKQILGKYQGVPTTQKEKDDMFLQEFLAKDAQSRHYGGVVPNRKRQLRE